MRQITRAILAIIVPVLAVALLLFVLAGCDVINPPPPEEVVLLGTKQIHEFEEGTVVTSSWMVIDNETVTRKITLGDLLAAELPAAVSTLVVTETLGVGGDATFSSTITAVGPIYENTPLVYAGAKIVIANPYTSRPNAYKGQLHAHSDQSDGVGTPTEVATAYRNAGYDFMSLTDHDMITPDPGVGILFITGVEETHGFGHILGIGAAAQSTETEPQLIIDFHIAQDAVPILAHPNSPTSAEWTDTEIRQLTGFMAIEAYNRAVGAANSNAEDKWDAALSEYRFSYGTAADDLHVGGGGVGFDEGWVVVYADSLSEASILDALRRGNFTSSTGPTLTMSLDQQTITAVVDSSSNVEWIVQGGAIAETDAATTSATYTIVGDEVYVRAKATRISDSEIAWSNPIYINRVGQSPLEAGGGIQGPLFITGTLDVLGDVVVTSTLEVVGFADFQSTVRNSTGNLTLNDFVDISGPVDMESPLNVDGNISSSVGAVTVTDELAVTSPGNITHTIQAGAGFTATLKLVEFGAGDVGAYILYDGDGNELEIWTGNDNAVRRLSIARDSGALNFTSPVDFDLTFNVDGATTLAGLDVSAATNLQGNISSSAGAVTITDSVNITGPVDLDDTFNVDGASTMGDITSDGDVGIGGAPSEQLHVRSITSTTVEIEGGANLTSTLFLSEGDVAGAFLRYDGVDNHFSIWAGNPPVERLRIDRDNGLVTILGAASFNDDLTFTGSGLGLQHGYVWGNEITWTQASAVQNTWYNISDAGMTSGPLNGIEHDGNGLITVTVAGMYMADWSSDAEANAANQHVQLAFSVDGSATEFGQTHFETIGVNRESAVSSTAILDLAAGQTVEVAIRTTEGGTPDLFVDHMHLRVVQIAGT